MNANGTAQAASGGNGVAIVGMSCLFPGASNLDAYWNNILAKVDAVGDPPPEAWETGVYFDPDFTDTDKIYCRRGGYLGSLLGFDPLAHSIPPVSVGGEPDQWVAFQLASDALADAGCTDLPAEVRSRTSIVLGKGTYLNAGNAVAVQRSLIVGQTLELIRQLHPEFTDETMELLREDMKRTLPATGPEKMAGLIPNIVVGRIANRLDLMGPTYTVDAACASSLVAVQLAMRDLLNGECDLAVAGGSQVWMPVPALNVFCQLGALSRRQQIRPFDKDADGTILGEGIGMVVLKRVTDAVRDGDRVYAVVKGVGVSTDGRGTSVMAPRVEGEELALRRAYAEAGVDPETVGLIEAHGTATPVGDVTEIQALSRVFGPRRGELPRCAIGTVKSMISHTIPASGVAGMIKLALALHHKILPPTLHCDQPNPKLALEASPFYVNTECRPWIHGRSAPRRAGINAFGFGGINAHAVLEEFHGGPGAAERRSLPDHAPSWPTEVCILESESRAGLAGTASQLAGSLERILGNEGPTSLRLTDLAFTLGQRVSRSPEPVRLGIVAVSLEDLHAKLVKAAGRLEDAGCRRIRNLSGVYYEAEPLGRNGKTVFLFPGEGAQYPGMLGDLCLHFPEVREVFDRSDRIYLDHPRQHLPSDHVFPCPTFSAEEQQLAERRLMQMDSAIEAVLTANQAMFALVGGLGLRADVCLGHSAGEYSAAIAAGILDLDDDDRLVSFSRAMNGYYADAVTRDGVPRAGLLALGTDRRRAEAIATEAGSGVYVAIDNCPHQTVLVGEPASIERARRIADREGLIANALPYDRAVHTPLFEPYTKPLHAIFSGVRFRPGQTQLYSCTTGGSYPADPSRVGALFVNHWTKPVEFRATIEALHAEGGRLFVEVGPRGNLSAFVDDILRDRSFCAVPADVPHRAGVTQINHLVAQLAAHGVVADLGHLYRRRNPCFVDVNQPPTPMRASTRINLGAGWPMLRLSPEVVTEVRRASAADGRPPATAADTSGNGHVPSGGLPSAPAPPSPPPSLLPDRRGSGRDDRAAVVSAHLETMDRFLAVNEEIMLAYLAGAAAPAPATAAVSSPATATAPPVASAPPVPAALRPPAGAPRRMPFGEPDGDSSAGATSGVPEVTAPESPNGGAPAAAGKELVAAAHDRGRVTAQLLALVSERTGYPVEMIDVKLDLEADLGIDSIKRVEILGNYRQQAASLEEIDLEALAARRTIEQIVDVLVPVRGNGQSPSTSAAPGLRAAQVRDQAPGGAPPFGKAPVGNGAVDPQTPAVTGRPLLGAVVSWSPGEELVTRRLVDPAHDRYLRDHALGRVPGGPDGRTTGLAVMPLTMSLEMLAEAAVALVPGRRVTGMRNVHAHRWLAWDDEPLTLEVTARVVPSDDASVRVAVTLGNLDEAAEGDDGTREAVVEAVAVLGDAYPVPPAARERPAGAGSSAWTPERLYTEGMFHGPAWQGVAAIEHVSDPGAVARLRVLPVTGFFATSDAPRFELDPVVLDAAGQVIGFWAAERLASGNVVFPFRLAALDVFGPPRAPGEELGCVASIELEGAHVVRSDIDVTDADGRLWMRLTNWEDKRFDVPSAFRPLVLGAPTGRTTAPTGDAERAQAPHVSPVRWQPISTEWRTPLEGLSDPGRFRCRLIGATFSSDRGLWKRVWAQAVLNPVERVRFRSLRAPEARQLEWLAGHTAAKEAVQELVREERGLDLALPDIEVHADAHGRPIVAGNWLGLDEEPPAVSISHSRGLAVALAAWSRPGGTPPRIGIDIECFPRAADAFSELAFSADERRLVEQVPHHLLDEWLLRCWCAKEAAGKAVGLGLTEGPRSVSIVALDREREEISVRLGDTLVTAQPDLVGVFLRAHSLLDGDVVVAVTACEEA